MPVHVIDAIGRVKASAWEAYTAWNQTMRESKALRKRNTLNLNVLGDFKGFLWVLSMICGSRGSG